MTSRDIDDAARLMASDLVPDVFWMDDGFFVAPRDGHPAALALELNDPDDWKKLQRRWAIPAGKYGGTCWGEQGDENGEQTSACLSCRCFQVVSLAEARRLSPNDRQPIWYMA